MATVPPYPLSDLEAGTHNPPPTTTHQAPAGDSNNDDPSDHRVPVRQDRTSTPPPEYKPHDMEEPLPPYIERVRMVMREDSRKRTIAIFVPLVMIIAVIIGVSIGIRPRHNSNENVTGATKI